MEFQNSIINIIKKRTSVRTYEERVIDKETLQKLKCYISEINSTANINAKFMIVNNESNDNKIKSIGTYGVISGANSFIIGIMEKNKNDAFEFGYLFEKIILFATDLGLSTCWLGGTFKKTDFEQFISLGENEFIPIVSPLGYKKGKPRIIDTTMRVVAGSNKRKPWNELFFDENLMPLVEKTVGLYATVLEMVRLGPSASNKQPWRVVTDGSKFHFFLLRTKGYGLDSYDLQKNDMGIAKCHFELSANELGLKGIWSELDDVSIPNGWEYIVSWNAL